MSHRHLQFIYTGDDLRNSAWVTLQSFTISFLTGEGFRALCASLLLLTQKSHSDRSIDHRSNEMERRLRFSFLLFTLLLLSSTARSDLVISKVERWVRTFTFFFFFIYLISVCFFIFCSRLSLYGFSRSDGCYLK